MDAVRGWFGEEVERRKAVAMETKDMFDNAFRFLETTFGNSQELVIFVTEITVGYNTSWFVEQFGCDAYFTSSNAITTDGVLYNVDGNSNRVACIVFGPRQVIMIVGRNKIVDTFDQAVERVKRIAAPRNTRRLHCKTPCAATGHCISLDQEDPALCDGCFSPQRVCCNYVTTAFDRHIGRIKVLIVDEELGY